MGYQAADTLRSYGYPDLAQEYERVLHRASLAPNEILAHSRIASTALKELNALSQEKHGGHPVMVGRNSGHFLCFEHEIRVSPTSNYNHSNR
ncbi:MAG: hypothetical protein ACFB15_26680 [Cyclobacteriaceae bacterium]